MYRVLICGSRDWSDERLIRAEMKRLPKDTTVIEGEAPGADSLARQIGVEMGFVVEPYPAEWDRHGKAAGPIRNQKMLDSKPDELLAFCAESSLADSRGTADMVKKAKAAGISCKVFFADGSAKVIL